MMRSTMAANSSWSSPRDATSGATSNAATKSARRIWWILSVWSRALKKEWTAPATTQTRQAGRGLATPHEATQTASKRHAPGHSLADVSMRATPPSGVRRPTRAGHISSWACKRRRKAVYSRAVCCRRPVSTLLRQGNCCARAPFSRPDLVPGVDQQRVLVQPQGLVGRALGPLVQHPLLNGAVHAHAAAVPATRRAAPPRV